MEMNNLILLLNLCHSVLFVAIYNSSDIVHLLQSIQLKGRVCSVDHSCFGLKKEDDEYISLLRLHSSKYYT